MFKKKKNLHPFPVISSQKLDFYAVFGQFCRYQNLSDIMNGKIEKYISALLLDKDCCEGRTPYQLDNLFYEKFGMSCDEVLKNYGNSIDILS